MHAWWYCLPRKHRPESLGNHCTCSEPNTANCNRIATQYRSHLSGPIVGGSWRPNVGSSLQPIGSVGPLGSGVREGKHRSLCCFCDFQSWNNSRSQLYPNKAQFWNDGAELCHPMLNRNHHHRWVAVVLDRRQLEVRSQKPLLRRCYRLDPKCLAICQLKPSALLNQEYVIVRLKTCFEVLSIIRRFPCRVLWNLLSEEDSRSVTYLHHLVWRRSFPHIWDVRHLRLIDRKAWYVFLMTVI